MVSVRKAMCIVNVTTDFDSLMTREVAQLSDHCDVASIMHNVLLLLLSACLGFLALFSWALWWLYFTSLSTTSSKLPLPPGSMGLPFIGETLNLLIMGSKFYRTRCKLYGDIFKTHLLGRPIVRVLGACNVRKVLLGENTLVTSSWPTSVRMMLGSKTIVTSSGDVHRHLRKVVSKAFSYDLLAMYAPVMQHHVRDFLALWCQAGTIHGFRECKRLTFAIACSTITGIEEGISGQQDCMLDLFHTWTDNFFSLPINIPGCGLSKGLRARKALLQIIEECMTAKERQPEVSSEVLKNNALSMMMGMEGEEKLTREELKDICLELMFAGHASTASTSTSLLYFLARNPTVVQCILEELEKHGLRESQPGDLSLEKVSQLTYVGHVIKECLRLAPPIGAGFRKAIKTFEINGFQVPAGWSVVYSIRETQAFSDLFTESDRFDPDRWVRIEGKDATYDFIPFGRGVRSCVGKEHAMLLLKIFVVELTRSCTWHLLNEREEMIYLPITQPVGGLPMTIAYRQPLDKFASNVSANL